MISSPQGVNSELALMQSIHKLTDAGCAVIQVRTREPLRAALTLRKHLLASETPYKEWNCVDGFRVFTCENYTEHRISGDGKDFVESLGVPLVELRNPSSEVSARVDKLHFFVYVDPHPYVSNNPFAAELLQQYAAMLPSTNVCMVLVTPDLTLPGIPPGTVLVAELPTPSVSELQAVLTRILTGTMADKTAFPGGSELEEEDLQKIANMGLGLSLYEFETYTAIAIVEAGEKGDSAITLPRLLDGVAQGKTAVVRQSEILELTHPESIDNVGGMGRLKAWLTARVGCYTEDARAFGVEPPKGLILAGVSGTGKSLVAKACASVFGVPLVRLDFARVFSKFVGDSEHRVRAALKMVEDMAPVVLFVDEVDKALGGAGGGGDSGTSSRVLGSFLTWLQECKAPVFTVVTANRVDGLPPELLRRGRFDQIFSVTLPSPEERIEVLAIHLRKRGRDIKNFNKDAIADFIVASDEYVPAEIESAVKDALVESFGDLKCQDVEMKHILSAFKNMVPMARSNRETIERITTWATNNATPVSYPAKLTSPGNDSGANRARVIRPGARRISSTVGRQ